jgi:hypothetical protein
MCNYTLFLFDRQTTPGNQRPFVVRSAPLRSAQKRPTQGPNSSLMPPGTTGLHRALRGVVGPGEKGGDARGSSRKVGGGQAAVWDPGGRGRAG